MAFMPTTMVSLVVTAVLALGRVPQLLAVHGRLLAVLEVSHPMRLMSLIGV
ncbi:hypothetical protein ACQP1K_00190 [Sphaerimonospora sp. CA-214678]|uniref:hypothetical protein n=1 Tax=Sphaerimonospora sp. CA-214678 TaxID=3240029 RepID=UPI003D8F4EA0